MDLFSRAKKLGIQTEFVDGQGHRHVTDAAALKIILDALPMRAPYRFLREAVVIRSGHPARTALKPAARLPLQWKIVAGPEVVAEGQARDHRAIVWPADFPEGSYRLHLTDASSFTEEAPLVRAAQGLSGRFRPRLADGGPALRHPLGAQLGHRRL
jgi:4-alpha-glucanotransferase